VAFDFYLLRFKEDEEIRAWLKFLFELGFSALIGFLTGSGGALTAGSPTAMAIGAGFLGAAAGMVSVFLHSRKSFGLMISVPKQITEKLHENPDQVVIERN